MKLLNMSTVVQTEVYSNIQRIQYCSWRCWIDFIFNIKFNQLVCFQILDLFQKQTIIEQD